MTRVGRLILIALLTASMLFAVTLSGFAAEKVIFAGWSGEEAASKPIINWMMESFEEDNPGVDISWLGWPWQQTLQQLVLRYRSNQAPDASQIDMNWLNALNSLDSLVDLNEVFGKEFLAERIEPGVLALGQINGKQVALPWTVASIGMVANTTVLKAAGIEAIPTTIEQFEAALKAIKKTQPDVIPYAISTKGNDMITPDFLAWLWTFGGQLFDENGKVAVNSSAAVKTLTWLKSLMDQGLIAKDIDRFASRTLFAQHKVGFYDDAVMARGIARSNSGEGTDFDVNVKPMPRPTVNPGDNPQSVAWGHALVLFKQSGKPITADSPAAKFMAHLVFNDEVSVNYFKDQGMLPVTKTAIGSNVVKADQYSVTWADFTATSRRDETAMWTNSEVLRTAIGEEVQSALLGMKTPEKAIADLAKRLEQATLEQ
jgi:multiple sugar transport system substrate-binding protein